MNHGLGRKRSPRDLRDWTPDKLMAKISAGEAEPVKWSDPVILNQGETPHCVGYGSAGYIATSQKNIDDVHDVDQEDAERIYYEAKVRDGEPRQENGSYVRTGAKVLQKDERVIDNYAFGSFEQGKRWVREHGPVVIGIDWFEGMYTPKEDGVIKPSGKMLGGHCILWYGTDIKLPGRTQTFNLLRNSWGKEWGVNGDCYISDFYLKLLINERAGECMMAVKKATPTSPPPKPKPTQSKSFWQQLFDAIFSVFKR